MKRIPPGMTRIALLVLMFLLSTVFGQDIDILMCEDDDDDMYTYFLDDPFVRTTLRGISVGRIGTERKEYVGMHYVSCECEDDDDDMYTYFLDDPFVRTTLRGISVGRIGTERKEYVGMHYVSCEDAQPESEMLAQSLRGKCGLRAYDSRYSPYLNENRIVNGEHASYGEFPWQASIDVVFQEPHRKQYCGASIINEFWLLSAAHCFDQHPTHYVVTVGNHDWSNRDHAEQTFRVEAIIAHEQYIGEPDGYDHDIALVKIKQSASGRGIQFNAYVQPVCLPDSTASFQEGTKCVVSGWGATENPSYDDRPGVLMKTELKLVNNRKCQQMHGLRITDRMLCAGDLTGHTSPCNGDSGGGLVYRNRGAYTLLGVVSWGHPNCNVPNKPGVFAHVLNLLPWIKSSMNSYSDSYEQRILPSRP